MLPIHFWFSITQNKKFQICRYRWYAALFLFLACCSPQKAHSQENTVEFWPEVDLWLRVSPSWRFSVFVPISSNLETKYREGNLIVQSDFAWAKSRRFRFKRLFDENKAQQMKIMLTRLGYLGAKSLNDKGDAYKEYMGFLEQHIRSPLKGNFLLSHRIRPEARWIGDDHDLSYRIRYRAMLEKEINLTNVSWIPYINAELYYDSRYETTNRLRASGGTSVSWTPRFLIEGNITYQHDSKSSVAKLYALNLILHIFFETGGKQDSKVKSAVLRPFEMDDSFLRQ